jgi:hypothetical protein
MHYKDQEVPFTRDEFDRLVPLTPKEYRKRFEGDLNEWRARAGLPAKKIYETDRDLKALQNAAGI